MTAPELDIQGILRRHWEADATSLGEAPEIHTGEYDRGDGDVPVITITDGTEGPINGGQTQYSGIDGGGDGGMQRLGGARTVDCVAGSYDDLENADPNGGNLNPKQLRWEMYDHAAQLLVDHQLDTDNISVAPGEATLLAEAYDSDGSSEYVFSIQFRARYIRDRHPR